MARLVHFIEQDDALPSHLFSRYLQDFSRWLNRIRYRTRLTAFIFRQKFNVGRSTIPFVQLSCLVAFTLKAGRVSGRQALSTHFNCLYALPPF